VCACDLHRSDLRSSSSSLECAACSRIRFFSGQFIHVAGFFFSKLDFRCHRSPLVGVPAQAKSALAAHRFFLKGSALDFAVPICLGVVLATVFCLGLASVFVFRALDLFSLSVSTDILAPDLCA
jgi:hypothetical protein